MKLKSNIKTHQSSKANSIRIIKVKSRKSDIIFTLISLIILFFLSFLLYKDIYKTHKGIGKPVGIITFKKRTALRKLQNQAVWEYLQNEFPIYNGDAIKTEELSEAILRLEDGTEIFLNENTFIVINFTGKEAKINFNYGSLETNSSKNQQIKIKTKDSEIVLNSANAKLTNQKESLQIQVEKGEANIQKNGKIEAIKENEVALLDKKTEEIKKHKIPIVLLSPPDNKKFFSFQKYQTVDFSFQGDPNESYKLLISFNSSFRPIYKQIPIRKKVTLRLSAGDYYWQVVPSKKDSFIGGFYRKFSIIQKQRPILYTPSNQKRLFLKEKSNINFSWSKLDMAGSYEIWIDTSSDFSNPRKISTLTNFISVSFQPQNKESIYYWKVIPRSQIADAVQESKVHSFYIRRLEKQKPAVLVAPIDEVLFTRNIRKGIIFTWQMENAGDQIIQIAKDRNFNTILISRKIQSRNFFRLKEALPPSTYYWRVINADQIPSQTGKFIISSEINIRILSPIKDQYLFFEKQKSILFRWKTQYEKQLHYLLVIGKDPQFKKRIFQIQVKQNQYQWNFHLLRHLKEGIYYWKVIAYESRQNQNSKPLSEKKSQFYLYHYPPTTKFLFPISHQRFNLININMIVFRWKKMPYTDYYIFEILKDKKTIYKKEVKHPFFRFRDFKKLKTGKFQCKVTGMRKLSDRILQSEPAMETFFLEYKIKKPPEFLTPEIILID